MVKPYLSQLKKGWATLTAFAVVASGFAAGFTGLMAQVEAEPANTSNATGYGDIFIGYVEPGTFEVHNSAGETVKTVNVTEAGPVWFTKNQELPVGTYTIHLIEAPGGYKSVDDKPAATVEVIDTQGRLPSGVGAFSGSKWKRALAKYKGVPNVRYGSVAAHTTMFSQDIPCRISFERDQMQYKWQERYDRFERNNWVLDTGEVSSPELMNQEKVALEEILGLIVDVENAYVALGQREKLLFDTHGAGLTHTHFIDDSVLNSLLEAYNEAATRIEERATALHIPEGYMIGNNLPTMTIENLYGMMLSDDAGGYAQFTPIGSTHHSTQGADPIYNGFHYGLPTPRMQSQYGCSDYTAEIDSFANIALSHYTGTQSGLTASDINTYISALMNDDPYTGTIDVDEWLTHTDWLGAFWDSEAQTNLVGLEFSSWWYSEYGEVDSSEMEKMEEAYNAAGATEPELYFRDNNNDEIITVDDFSVEQLETLFGSLYVATAEIAGDKNLVAERALKAGEFNFGLHPYNPAAQTREDVTSSAHMTSSNDGDGNILFMVAVSSADPNIHTLEYTRIHTGETLPYTPVSFWVSDTSGEHWKTVAYGSLGEGSIPEDAYWADWSEWTWGKVLASHDFWDCHHVDAQCLAEHYPSFPTTLKQLDWNYEFTIIEIAGSDSRIVYDEGIAYAKLDAVTPYGVNPAHKVVATRLSPAASPVGGFDEEGTTQEATFVNHILPYSEESLPIVDITKTLEGANLQGGDFEFQLCLDEQCNTVIETVTNDADGNVVFTTLPQDLHEYMDLSGENISSIFDQLEPGWNTVEDKPLLYVREVIPATGNPHMHYDTNNPKASGTPQPIHYTVHYHSGERVLTKLEADVSIDFVNTYSNPPATGIMTGTSGTITSTTLGALFGLMVAIAVIKRRYR